MKKEADNAEERERDFSLSTQIYEGIQALKKLVLFF